MPYHISSGQVSSGITLTNDSMYISSGGTLTDSLIDSGGKLYVYSQGLTSGVTLIGNQVTISGGTCVDDIVSSGGIQDVFCGGLVSRSVVSSGGQVWLAGGVASGVVILSGGLEAVRSNNGNPSYDYNAVIDGGLQLVFSRNGGYAYSATVRNGGVQSVYAGGVVSNTIVSGPGVLMVNTDGSAYNATILSGGLLRIHSDGVISGAEVESGGSMYLSSGAVLKGAILLAGSMTLRDAIDATEAVVTLDLHERTSADAALIGDYTLLGNTTLVVSVSSAQTGAYKLAANAASFDQSITVKTVDTGDSFSLTLGQDIATATRTYTLSRGGDDTLCFSVGTVSSIDDTNYPVMSTYQETGHLRFGMGNFSEFKLGDGGLSSVFITGIGGLTKADWAFREGDEYCPYDFTHVKISDAEKNDRNSVDDQWCGPLTGLNLWNWIGSLNSAGYQNEDDILNECIDNGSQEYSLSVVNASNITWGPKGDMVEWHLDDPDADAHLYLQHVEQNMRNGAMGVIEVHHGTPEDWVPQTGGHAMLLMGFVYDEQYDKNDPRHYSGIVVADSDNYGGGFDHSEDAPDNIRIIKISWDQARRTYWIYGESAHVFYLETQYHNPLTGPADLTWYHPNDWGAPMTLSTSSGVSRNAPWYRSDESIYVNFAVTNQGLADSGNFHVSLYVDNLLKETFKVDSLQYGKIADFENYNIGQLSVGMHVISAVIDSDDNVAESTKKNNVFSKNIEVHETSGYGLVSSGSGFAIDTDTHVSRLQVLDGVRIHIRGGNAQAENMIVSSGGMLVISSGGLLTDSLIDSSGKLYVYSQGLTSRVTLIDNQATISGGTCVDDIVSSGGIQDVFSGGLVSRSVVSSGGQIWLAGGQALDAVVSDGGGLYVRSNGSDLSYASGAQISSGGFMDVYDSSTAEGTVIHEGGYVRIRDFGIASNTLIESGASMYVHSSSGLAVDTVVSGFARVYDEALMSNTVITSGASFHLWRGGIMKDAEVQYGGLLDIRESAPVLTGKVLVAGQLKASYDQNIDAAGAIITLDLTRRSDTDDYSIINLNYLGETNISITVADNQAAGVYKLASNAANFASAMSLSIGTKTYDDVLTAGGIFAVGGRDYALAFDSDNTLTLTVSGDPEPPVVSGLSGDLNADGRADIVMTITEVGHGAEGATGAWLIQDDQTAEWGNLSQRNPGWEIFGTGKTAAGKNTDDVYIKSSDNVIGAWTIGDDGKVNGWETVGEFDSETQIVGLGDFNGNGQTDLLLRNVNGAVGCFFTGDEKHGWNYFQSLGDEWKLTAVGDLNGDGRDDVVLKHDAGFAGSWLTQEDGTMAWADLDTLPEGFEIVGAGDFDGDGTDDVLLKNGNYYGAWLVQNGNAAGWMGLGDLGDVTVEQIADFNGDGKDDLRIRTAAGDLGTQLVMGEDNLVWKYYGSVGSEWSTALAALA